MTTLYQSKDGKRKTVLREGVKIPTRVYATEQKGYVYLIRVENSANEKLPRLFHKVGTSVHPARRLLQLAREYKAERIVVLWISPQYAESTYRRLEWHIKDVVSAMEGSTMIPLDRFVLPNNVDEISFKVRKEYTVVV
jgi:hypothetical protein